MINITTAPDLRLFISGDYISVARGFNRTINFSTDLPPVATPPPSLLINGTTNINLATHVATATSTGIPSSESRTFYYEVVSPKVVYKFFPDEKGVIFYDVSSVSSFPHPDVITSNTSWIQNPQLISSRIVIEEKVGTSWVQFDTFPVAGVSSMHYWEGLKTFRSVLQKVVGGTVVFEAVGDVFQIEPQSFKSSDIKFKYNENEQFTGKLYDDEWLTVLPGKVYQIDVINEGINYKYHYVNSSLSPAGTGYTYSSSSRILTITNFPDTVNLLTFQFQLQEKRFIDGLLVNTSNNVVLTKTLNVEVVKTNLQSAIQQSCSSTVVFQDATIINNPYFRGKGRVFYEIQIANKWIPIGSTERLGFLSYSNCDLPQGTYKIRKRYVAREIPNCGGVSQIVLVTDWKEATFQILDYKPLLELGKPESCCLTLGSPQTVLPVLIDTNKELCDSSSITGGYDPNEYNPNHYSTFSASNQTLTYHLSRYDIEEAQWIPVNSKDILIVSNNVSSASYTFTPNKIGKYKLKGTLKNCCGEAESEVLFDVCDCLDIRRKCSDLEKCNDCQLYVFVNNCSQAKTVNIKLAKTNQLIHTVTISSGSTYEHRFVQDDLYRLEYDDKIALIPVYCTIESCYNKLLKEQLCKTNSSNCCNDKELFNGRLATVQPIYQLFLNKLEKYNVKVNYRYTLIDVTNQLSDFQEIDKIKEALLKYCDICRLNCPKCFDWNKGTCI